MSDGYQLFDLGSGNGTLLNGQVVQAAPLRSGDTITLGQSVLLYTVGPTDAPSANELAERVRPRSRRTASFLTAWPSASLSK